MSDFFRDKVVAITGGSDGIGKALVENYWRWVLKLPPVPGTRINSMTFSFNSTSPLHCIVADVSNYE
jgi:NADP-dependent 3-hydroxy acid dehydrogenase YdfG